MNPSPLSTGPKARVLFVCTGNTCRSVMAEHIARRKFSRYMDVESAGLQPGSAEDAENAIYTLKALLGVDASSHSPRDVRGLDLTSFDFVVGMTNQITTSVRELFPGFPKERFLRWQILDPYGDNLAEYERCAKKIHDKLQRLVSTIQNSPLGES